MSRMDFFKICYSNIFGPKYCFRILPFCLWKWSLFLLTLKLDEALRLLWQAKCIVSDTTHQRLGDKGQYGFHLTLCSPWECWGSPGYIVVVGVGGWPTWVFQLIVPAKVSPDSYHQFQVTEVSKPSGDLRIQTSSFPSWHQMGQRRVIPAKPCPNCRVVKKKIMLLLL